MSADWYVPLISIAATAAVSWAVWVTKSHMDGKKDLADFKLEVARGYADKDVTNLIFKKLDNLSIVVYEIAGKLQIPVKKE